MDFSSSSNRFPPEPDSTNSNPAAMPNKSNKVRSTTPIKMLSQSESERKKPLPPPISVTFNPPPPYPSLLPPRVVKGILKKGFGAPTGQPASTFGQSQLFGKSATPAFGAGASLFSAAPQPAATSSLFASGQQATFGTGAPAATFPPASIFASAPSASGADAFAPPNATAFGQANKPNFGFNSGPTPGTMFGQPSVSVASAFQPNSGGMFGTTSAFGTQAVAGTAAGTAAVNQQPGTVVKFVPVTGSDTMQKAGIAHSINTKHYCISCMKEYENKSLEELRWEDYQCNRKGAIQPFSTPPFSATATVSTAGGLFDSKSTFPQTAFGAPSTGFNLMNQGAQSGVFGKPATTTTFGFNVPNTSSAFANAPKQFGAAATPSVFGAAPSTQPQQPAFGSSVFGQTSTQAPFTAQTSFGFPQTAPTQQLGFQTPKTTAAFSMPFGQTNTTSFAQPNVFGQQSNPFAAASGFKAPTMTFNPQPTQQMSFGLNTGFQQPNANPFGATSKPSGLFGATTTSSFFTAPNQSFQTGSTGFMMPQQQQQQAPQQYYPDVLSAAELRRQEFQNLVKNFYDPFPWRSIYSGLTPKKPEEFQGATNQRSLKELMECATAPRVDTNAKLKVTPYKSSIQRHPIFQGPPMVTSPPNLFPAMRTGKHLFLKKTSSDVSLDGSTVTFNRNSPLFKKFTSSLGRAPATVIGQPGPSQPQSPEPPHFVDKSTAMDHARMPLTFPSRRPTPKSSQLSFETAAIPSPSPSMQSAIGAAAQSDSASRSSQSTGIRALTATASTISTAAETEMVTASAYSETPSTGTAQSLLGWSETATSSGTRSTTPSGSLRTATSSGQSTSRQGDTPSSTGTTQSTLRWNESGQSTATTEAASFTTAASRSSTSSRWSERATGARTTPRRYETTTVTGDTSTMRASTSDRSVGTEEQADDSDDSDSARSFYSAKGVDETDDDSDVSDDSETKEKVEDEGEGRPPRPQPFGIKLKRWEYYTLPSLEQLMEYRSTDGRCMVQGFTVGRIGYGNVYFPDTIDVCNLDLDAIVNFTLRAVSVYPDETVKPPVGEGLNRPAQITLDNVWPRGRHGGRIRNPIKLRRVYFVERLQEICIMDSTEFVDYRPETGSWVFKVPHFSLYSFTDEKDEMAMVSFVDRKGRQKVDGRQLSFVSYAEFQDDSDDEVPAKKRVPSKTVRTVQSQSKTALTVEPQRGLGGGVTNDYDNMEFSDSDDVAPVLCPSDKSLPPVATQMSRHEVLQQQQLIKAAYLFDDDVTIQKIQTGQQLTPAAAAASDAAAVVAAKSAQAQSKETHPTAADRLKPRQTAIINYHFQVPFARELATTNNYKDRGAYAGRSFRCGWSMPATIWTIGSSYPKMIEHTPRPQRFLLVMDATTWPQVTGDPLERTMAKHMQVVLAESACTFDGQGVPTYVANVGNDALGKHYAIAESHVDASSSRSRYYRDVWDLCNILWGEESTDEEYTRGLFSDWIKRVTAPAVEHDLTTIPRERPENQPFKKILYLMTGNQVREACKVALRAHMPRLTLLLSQYSGNYPRLIMERQLLEWHQYEMLDYINDDLVKVVHMLATTMETPGYNVFENLDWKRALGMHFWYLARCGCSIKEAVHLYEETYRKEEAAAPHTWYNDESEEHDLMYQILWMYLYQIKQLSEIIDPKTHTTDSLDYRMSWLLFQTFRSVGMGLISPQCEEYLHINCANYLEQIGLWQYSVFVLLFLEDAQLKENEVMGVLDRNFQQWDADKEKYFITTLRVPKRWIYKVKMVRSEVKGDNWAVFRNALLAEDTIKMHQVFESHLLPEFYLHKAFDDIQTLTDVVSRADHSGCAFYVQVILDLIQAHETITQAVAENLDVDPFSIKELLYSICARIKYCKPTTLKQKLSLAEMSKYACNLMQIFFDDLYKQFSTADRLMTTTHLKELPMPPDYVMDVLFDVPTRIT